MAAAAKLLSPPPLTTPSRRFSSKPRLPNAITRYPPSSTFLNRRRLHVAAYPVDHFAINHVFLVGESNAGGYSLASYYTSLGLFVISVPGLWSLIKRSVKSKIVKKTYVGEEIKAPNQVAGEILSFFSRKNFAVTDRGETIT